MIDFTLSNHSDEPLRAGIVFSMRLPRFLRFISIAQKVESEGQLFCFVAAYIYWLQIYLLFQLVILFFRKCKDH